MKLRITITVQCSDLPETPIFEADVITPETVYSTLMIAEQSARSTVAALYRGHVCIREYLGPTLIATLHSGPEDGNRKSKPAPVQYVQIRNKYSGKVLDARNLSSSNTAVIQQWDYLQNASQHWQVPLIDHECYKITNRLSGKAIEALDGVQSDAAGVEERKSSRDKSQKWQLTPIDTGYFAFVNKLSGKVLAVQDCSRNNGALIRQEDYLGRDNQKWQIARVSHANEQLAEREEDSAASEPGIMQKILGMGFKKREAFWNQG